MRKYLVTGFSGFVSGYFVDLLERRGIEAEVIGVDAHEAPAGPPGGYGHLKVSSQQVDLLDRDRLADIFTRHDFDYVLHLASISSVQFSWQHPLQSFMNNINIFLNVLECLRETGSKARVLSVGSSEEYGTVPPDRLPLREEMSPDPGSPYAVARAAQEMISKVYAQGYGLDIVMTRSFNHIGAGQKDAFAVPSFARQLVGIRGQGRKQGTVIAGDVSVVRDFLDVRDVVEAYHALLEGGRSGEVYNVCSGRGVSLREVIELMADLLGLQIEVMEDGRLKRPSDGRIVVGSNEKIARDIGWKPRIGLRDSLQDVLGYWTRIERQSRRKTA